MGDKSNDCFAVLSRTLTAHTVQELYGRVNEQNSIGVPVV